MTLAERFFAKVEPEPNSGCWLWTGSRQGNGYGFLHMGGHRDRRAVGAHRVSYQLHVGEVPAALWVLHRCDNPPCVNPAHLFIGDRRANMLDAGRKGRISTIGKSRQTACRHGHLFSPENTIRDRHGHRRCRICADAYSARRWSPTAIRERASVSPGSAGATHIGSGQETRDGT